MQTTPYKYMKMLRANADFLKGAQYFTALKALEFGRQHHIGKRKDGSHEYSHQLSIGLYVRSIHTSLLYPEPTFATVYLHDVTEDYDVSNELIRLEFGSQIADSVYLMDKNRAAKKLSMKDYYGPMSDSPIVSLAKGADRMHNFNSMVGVFTRERQIAYMRECRLYILPMLKRAQHKFTEQFMAFDNLRHILKMQIELISRINNVPSGI